MGLLISAGFLILRPQPRLPWASADLLPEEIVSASACLCPQFPGSYAIAWTSDTGERRGELFEAIGLLPAAWHGAIEWATKKFQQSFGWPGVFYNLQEAEAAKALFFANESKVKVIGLGLPPEFVEAFMAEAMPPPSEPGYSPIGKSGSLEVVEQQQPLPEGQLLGFELLDVEYGILGHSWLCNNLEAHFYTTFGIRPNEHGLLSDLESAKRCCESIERAAVGAEPGLWLPWGLVSYD